MEAQVKLTPPGNDYRFEILSQSTHALKEAGRPLFDSLAVESELQRLLRLSDLGRLNLQLGAHFHVGGHVSQRELPQDELYGIATKKGDTGVLGVIAAHLPGYKHSFAPVHRIKNSPMAEITGLAVEPKHRRQNIGTFMARSMIEHLISIADIQYICTRVREHNVPFFQQLGFNEQSEGSDEKITLLLDISYNNFQPTKSEMSAVY